MRARVLPGTGQPYKTKRGYTKPFSRGKMGEEQRQMKRRRDLINYYLKNNDYEKIDQLLNKWVNNDSMTEYERANKL